MTQVESRPWRNVLADVLANGTPEAIIQVVDTLKMQQFEALLNTDADEAADLALALQQAGLHRQLPHIVGIGLLAQGDISFNAREYRQAQDRYEQAADKFASIPEPLGVARAHIITLIAILYQGKMRREKLLAMEPTRQMLTETREWYRLATLEQNVGVAYQHLGALEDARNAYRRGLAALSHLPTEETAYLRAMLLGNMATILAWVGEIDAALDLRRQVHAIFLDLQRTLAAAHEEVQIGELEAQRWRFREALSTEEAAIAHFLAVKHDKTAAAALKYRADILIQLNRYPEALADVDQAITYLAESPIDLARTMLTKARALRQSKRYGDADQTLMVGEALVKATQQTLLILQIRLERASLLFQQQRYPEARAAALRVLRSPASQVTRMLRATAQLIVAQSFLELSQPEFAAKSAQAVISVATTLGAPKLSVDAEVVLARLNDARGNAPEALRHYERAIGQLFSAIDSLEFDQRAEFLEDKNVIFLQAVDLAERQHRNLDAITYLEQGRAFATTAERALYQGGRDTAHAEVLTIHAQLNSLWGRLADPATPAFEAAGIRKTTQQLERRLRDLHHAQPTTRASSLRIESEKLLRIAPEGGTALIYATLERDLLIFVVHDQHITAVYRNHGGTQKIEDLAHLLTLQIHLAAHGRGIEQAKGIQLILNQLWQQLIAPIKEYLPDDGAPLVLVPHGVLHALPLLALFDGEQYLVERWLVRCVAACQTHTRPTPTSTELRPLLAVGYADAGALPAITQEVKMVAQHMHGEVCDEATVGRFLQEAPGRAYVHMAAHGHFRSDAPYASSLLLADGPLYASDILTLDLQGCQLVTLSACETGRGRPSGGDAQLGLARMFFYAGAEAVLATLWKIEDTSTARFMECFYHHLAADSMPHEALRQAQIALLHPSGAARQHPYFWAGFQLTSYPVVRRDEGTRKSSIAAH